MPFAIFKVAKSGIFRLVSSSPIQLFTLLESYQLGRHHFFSNLLHTEDHFKPTSAATRDFFGEECCWLLISTGFGRRALKKTCDFTLKLFFMSRLRSSINGVLQRKLSSNASQVTRCPRCPRPEWYRTAYWYNSHRVVSKTEWAILLNSSKEMIRKRCVSGEKACCTDFTLIRGGKNVDFRK